jgi:acyl-CoA synthetase (AMP-forming)/AMP-acid ligase II
MDMDSQYNIASQLSAQAKRIPYKRAVVAPCGYDRAGRIAYAHLTFRQLDRESDRIAAGLVEMGIRKGIRTVLMVKPSLDFFALTFALFKAGAVPVVVDPGMGLRRMLRCLQESRPQAFIGIGQAHMLRIVYRGYFRSVSKFVTVGRRWFWGGATLDQLQQRPWAPFQQCDTQKDEMAAILFTTGSTGPAKGVVYTHGNFQAQIRQIQQHFAIADDEIDLPTFPLFALFDPALGMTAIIPDMDPTRPARVDPRRIIEPIVNHGVTNMFASPALLYQVGRFGRQKGIKLPSLKRVVSAGAPVSPANIEQFSHLLVPPAQIHTPYGATEAVPISSISSKTILNETRQLTDQGFGVCVGPPLDSLTIKIIGINDQPIENWTEDLCVPSGEVGEIAVSGDLVSRRYYQRPKHDALAKIATPNGFYHRMGDLGWFDQKGRIWFCGRKSHRVLTADGPLYTIPCEAIFNNHPRVYRSALVGIGPAGRQQPVICIQLVAEDDRRDLPKLTAELKKLAKTHEMTQSITIFLFHDAFPVDIRHNAKIFREQLAEWAQRKLKTH